MTLGRGSAFSRAIFGLAIFALATGAALGAGATRRAFFIGNSLTANNDIPAIVNSLASEAGDSLQCDESIALGQSLEYHLTNTAALAVIDAGAYDFVVLQEYSWYPTVPEYRDGKMFPCVRTFDDHIRRAGGRTVLYQTWGYPSGDWAHWTSYDTPSNLRGPDFLGMSVALRMAYARIGAELGAAVSPVGQAWIIARQERPDIALYLPNDYHPSYDGSYLAACAHYETLTGREPPPGANLDSTDAAYLQSAARRAVFDDPWSSPSGFGANNFYWAKSWSNWTGAALAPDSDAVISGAPPQESPSVLLDFPAAPAGRVVVGVYDASLQAAGQGRLYVHDGGSLRAEKLIVGQDGLGRARQDGGTVTVNGALELGQAPGGDGAYVLNGGQLWAQNIAGGAGAANFVFSNGALSFGQFGSDARPLDLAQSGGALTVTNAAVIGGDYTCCDGASLAVTLGGEGLSVHGAARLDGKLVISFPPGFSPAVGQSYPVVTARSLEGKFDTLSIPWTLRGSLRRLALIQSNSVVVSCYDDQLDTDGNGLPDWWEQYYFGSAISGQTWTNSALGDGIPNGVKFALDINPTKPMSPSAVAQLRFVNGQALLTYRQQPGGTGVIGENYSVKDITYTVEVSDSLSGPWRTGSNSVQWTGESADNADGSQSVTVRAQGAEPAADHLFMRLIIRRKNPENRN